MCTDLHIHSIYSDGSNTPLQLLEMALKNDIKAISLTDHDTIEGQREFIDIGTELGITVISGVEISARHEKTSLHILGYGIDPADKIFGDWLTAIQSGREERNKKILKSLNKLGIAINQKDLQQASQLGLTGRPHIASLLIEKGIVKTFNDAFKFYLGKGKKAWHSRFCCSAAETIAAIHAAGGVAIIAHPGQIDPHMRLQRTIVSRLVDAGLDGLEVYYPSHSKKMIQYLLTTVQEFDLIATGGSDFHGAARPANRLASVDGQFCPPVSIIADLTDRIAAKKQH